MRLLRKTAIFSFSTMIVRIGFYLSIRKPPSIKKSKPGFLDYFLVIESEASLTLQNCVIDTSYDPVQEPTDLVGGVQQGYYVYNHLFLFVLLLLRWSSDNGLIIIAVDYVGRYRMRHECHWSRWYRFSSPYTQFNHQKLRICGLGHRPHE